VHKYQDLAREIKRLQTLQPFNFPCQVLIFVHLLLLLFINSFLIPEVNPAENETVPQLGILNFLCALEVEARVIPHHHWFANDTKRSRGDLRTLGTRKGGNYQCIAAYGPTWCHFCQVTIFLGLRI